ncbi:MAG: Rossmann-like domain-containing protein [Anaerolineales bacterium]
MAILEQLLDQVAGNAERATPVDVRIGGHWTVVVLEVEGEVRGGLSSTLGGDDDDHHHGGRMPVQDAGALLNYSVEALAMLAHSESMLEASVGLATINALLDMEVDLARCVDVNAAEVILERGADRNVAIVGHFPFIPRVKRVAREMWVLELNPRPGDLPASAAPEVLPQADVIALTGTSLLTHTFDDLIVHMRPEAFVVMLGGTTPLTPLFFDYGVDALAGTLLEDPTGAMLAISQGATFKQIPGKRLVTIFREA